MGDGRVQVTFAEVAQAASDINNIHQNIESHLDQLKSKLQPIVSEWTGAAAESYQEAQHRWDSSAADLFATLAAIGGAVRQAGEGYEAAEGSAKKLWG
ncbi:MAG: WXG100 family type VII secretion target [Kutzneria sp.]|nr:WXG100 family type VII secretion target [Kutzneria sp.]